MKGSKPTQVSAGLHGQGFPADANLKLPAESQYYFDSSENTESSNTITCHHCVPHLPIGINSTSPDLLIEAEKEANLKLKRETLKNLEVNENIQSSDNVIYLPPRHIPHSSTGISQRVTNNLNEGGEEADLQMKLEENQRTIDGNESIQKSDSVNHLQPRHTRYLLMGLIPRPGDIPSRRGKNYHKKCYSPKDSTEIKDFHPNTKLEIKEIQTFKSVVLEDDPDMCDGSKDNQPLVEENRKKHASNEMEDETQSYGCALAAAAPNVSTASAVAAIVAAAVAAVAAPSATVAAPAAAMAAASAAVAAVVAAAVPAATAAASAAAAVDALASIAPGSVPESSAVPVAAATAATAAAVPAAASGAPDTASAVVAAAAAAGAAAVALASVGEDSLTAASGASVAAVVAAAVTAAVGSDAPTVAPAAAAVTAFAAATGPAAAAALVASLAAAVTPCVPSTTSSSAAAPSTVAAATAAAAAVANHAAASPAVAAAAAVAAAVVATVHPRTPDTATAAVAVAVAAPSDVPTAAQVTAAAVTKRRVSLRRKCVETGKQQSPVEAEEHDGIEQKTSKGKIKVLKPVKDTDDLNGLTLINESCSTKYTVSPLEGTPAFDAYKELVELKEINIQILTEKTKLENELSEIKEENSQLEKNLAKKNKRICTLRSILKTQMEKKRNIICANNEIVEELREKKMMERREEQKNRQVTKMQELEIGLKTRDMELKQLPKEKENAQKMENHLQMLELENTSLIATVKKQKEEMEQLQRHVQDTHKDLAQKPNFTQTVAQENQDLCKKHTTVITEMENTIKSLQSEVSSVKTSKALSKRELEKYKRFYLEELRNKNFLLHELNRTNESQEESHTELHVKFEENISVSNTLNTRLVNECSCVEKAQKLENKDFFPGENLVVPSLNTGPADACMTHCPWTSEDDMRELHKVLNDLNQFTQLSLETQKKQNGEVTKEPAGMGESFKMTDCGHEIGECGSHGDFKTYQLGVSTPATTLGCSEQTTTKPYSEFLRESCTISSVNEMETKIRSLKSTLSKLKIRKALRALELERYKYLYYEELSIRKSFQYYLNKCNKSPNRITDREAHKARN